MLKEVSDRKPPEAGKEEGVIGGVKVRYAGDAEKRKLSFIIGKLKKIPTGRKTLENLAEYGTTVCLCKIDAWGAYDLGKNVIALSAEAKNDKLCSTLVHEARHATQTMRAPDKRTDRADYDLETQIKIDRFREADAQVFAYQAVQEWSAAGNSKPFQEFYKSTPLTHNYYWAQQRRLGFRNGTDEARQVMFKAFFQESDRVAGYENIYMSEQALSVIARCIRGGEVDKSNFGSVHLTTEQVAAMTCGEYMKADDAFLKSDAVKVLTKTTHDVLSIASAVQGLDTGIEDFPVAGRLTTFLDANDVAISAVGGIYRESARILKKTLNVSGPMEIAPLYKESLEKQAETVKNFGTEEKDAFRRGKIADRLVGYFRNLVDVSSAELDSRCTNKEEKKAARLEIVNEKTAAGDEMRDYATVAAFIEYNREKNPALVEKALSLPELSESVKAELRFDNTVLARPPERGTKPLTKDDEKTLAVLSKSLSRSVKENPAALQKAIAAKNAER